MIRAAFLSAHGYAAATRTPLAQDASFRRYWRLAGGPRPALLMEAPPAHEAVGPFVRVAALLAAGGLSAPAILAVDAPHGLVLLEDFGATGFAPALATLPPTPLYDAATDTLATLARIPAPPDRPPPDLPAWDLSACGLPMWGPAEMQAATEATVLDWWWPAAFGAPADTPVRRALAGALRDMLAPLAALPAGLVHRDYFADNLFWLPDRPGTRRIGVIDFQDAAIGSPAYDLVSLVEDARRDLPHDLAARQIARYCAQRPELDRAGFADAYAICAAQRHLRVAALWVRLARRDGKPGYLRHGPRCWALLDRALAHPATAPLRAFLDAHVPAPLRANPPDPGVA